MKINAIVIVSCLLLSAVVCQKNATYSTVSDALKGRFSKDFSTEQLMADKFTKLQTRSTNELISCTRSKIADQFKARGISPALSKLLMRNIGKSTKGNSIRTTSIAKLSGKSKMTLATCVYQWVNQTVDMACLHASTTYETNQTNRTMIASAVYRNTYMGLKAEVQKVPQRLRSYHRFTKRTLGSTFLPVLGSPQTQAELDDLLRNAANEKEQVVFELNQNKNDPFLAKLFTNGISSYTSTTVVESVEGVDSSMLGEYAQFLADKMHVPHGEQRANVLDSMMVSAYADRGEWSEFSFVYKINGGTAKYVSVISNNNMDANTMDFLVADIQSGFEMAPDVIISTHTKSKFFGLFKSTTVKIVKRPAELTQRSIELLFKFFKVAAFEKFRAFRRV